MNSDMEMMADETAVSLRNLSFGFGRGSKSTVLSTRIDASLKYGELACVVGPVGGGKSLLAKTVVGLQPCFDGDVFLRFPPFGTVSLPMNHLLKDRGNCQDASSLLIQFRHIGPLVSQ